MSTYAKARQRIASEESFSDRLFLALDSSWVWVLRIFIILTVLAVMTPLMLTVMTSFSGSLIFPPRTWNVDAYRRIPEAMYSAFGTSVRLATLSVVLSMLISLPASLALVRGWLPGRTLWEALFRSPLQVPHVVMGVAFYQYYVYLLVNFGVTLRGEFAGLLAAHILILTPLMLSFFVARIAAVGDRHEEAAYGLGAGPVRTTLQITLPLMKPALIGAGIIGFLFSYNEVAASMFLTGVGTSTVPVEVLGMVEFEFTTVVYAVSTITVLLAVIAAVAIERFIGLRTVISA